MASSKPIGGSKRYPMGESLKTQRVVYEAPPPPPRSGEYPKKIPFWNLTGTVIGKEMNRNVTLFVLALAGFAGVIMYYGDSKMQRFVRYLNGYSVATPDKLEMDHARKANFLLNHSAMNVDNRMYDVALTRMSKLQDGAFSSIDWSYHDAGRVKWSASQPEYGVTE